MAVLDLWCLYVTELEIDFEDRKKDRANWRSSSPSAQASSAEESETQSDYDSDASSRRGRRSRSRSKSRSRSRSHSRTPSVFEDREERIEFGTITRTVLPWYSLVLCYLGCLLLRLPVFIRDLQKWANSGAIPYFFTAPDLPEELVSRFDLYRSGIERKNIPNTSKMRKAARTFRTLFEKRFNVTIPPPNAPLVWFRTVKDLCLPPEFYADMASLHRLLSDLDSPKVQSDIWNVSLVLIVFKLRCTIHETSDEMREWLDYLMSTKNKTREYAAWGTR